MAGAQLTFSGSFMAGLHFPAVFLPPSAFSERTVLSGDFAAWGEPTLQWVAAINGADVRKQPVSYPGNPSALPGLCWDLQQPRFSHGNSDKSWCDCAGAAQHRRHAATGLLQQPLKLGWPQGLGGCRESTAGCSKDCQPGGGCSDHFHLFSTFFPSWFLLALAGSCAGAHLHCHQPVAPRLAARYRRILAVVTTG